MQQSCVGRKNKAPRNVLFTL